MSKGLLLVAFLGLSAGGALAGCATHRVEARSAAIPAPEHLDHVARGIRLAGGGWSDEASALAKQLEAEEPECPHAPFILACIALSEQRSDEARSYVRLLATRTHDGDEARFLSALIAQREWHAYESWARSFNRARRAVGFPDFSGSALLASASPADLLDQTPGRAPRSRAERLVALANHPHRSTPLTEFFDSTEAPDLAVAVIAHARTDRSGLTGAPQPSPGHHLPRPDPGGGAEGDP